MQGAKPPVRIEGDVQLAAEVNWLADNVRWDVEEDLSRIIGDAPSHMLAQAARRLADGLRDFLGRKSTDAKDTSPGNPA
jgi:ubiquinone biosynthesis protein UbiJ